MTDTRDLKPDDTYLSSLHKLLPAELTAVHFALRAGASEDASLTPYFLSFSLALAVIFYFIAPHVLKITLPLERLVYCLTFVLWVLSVEASPIATDILTLGDSQRTIFLYVVSSIAIVWSFVTPYILLIFRKQ